MKEEKAKLECQHRLAQQDLLLRKDLDAAGLSELYRRLSATSQVLLQNLSIRSALRQYSAPPLPQNPGMDGCKHPQSSPANLMADADSIGFVSSPTKGGGCLSSAQVHCLQSCRKAPSLRMQRMLMP